MVNRRADKAPHSGGRSGEKSTLDNQRVNPTKLGLVA